MQKPTLNVALVDRLIGHYTENAPTGWETSECISGMVHKWHDEDAGAGGYFGTIMTYQRLGLSETDGDIIKRAANTGDPAHTYVNHKNSPQQNQTNVLGMLNRLKETGSPEWRHENILHVVN